MSIAIDLIGKNSIHKFYDETRATRENVLLYSVISILKKSPTNMFILSVYKS